VAVFCFAGGIEQGVGRGGDGGIPSV
jgi:hypothetical protein